MFSSFFSFYFYIIHSFLRPQRKLFSTIVTTSAISVIPLFLLNVSFNIFLLPRFYFLFYINLSHLLYTYLSLPFLAFLYLTISSLIWFSMYINFWLFILHAFMLSYSVYFCNHFCIYFILHFYYKITILSNQFKKACIFTIICI